MLSEGHGRALLMAPDHDARRRLARDAGAHGWSVRQTEARARAAAGRDDGEIAASRIERALHPDQVEAAERLGEAFGRALGADVRVTPKAERLPGPVRVRIARRGARGGRAARRHGGRLSAAVARRPRLAIIGAPRAISSVG